MSFVHIGHNVMGGVFMLSVCSLNCTDNTAVHTAILSPSFELTNNIVNVDGYVYLNGCYSSPPSVSLGTLVDKMGVVSVCQGRLYFGRTPSFCLSQNIEYIQKIDISEIKYTRTLVCNDIDGCRSYDIHTNWLGLILFMLIIYFYLQFALMTTNIHIREYENDDIIQKTWVKLKEYQFSISTLIWTVTIHKVTTLLWFGSVALTTVPAADYLLGEYETIITFVFHSIMSVLAMIVGGLFYLRFNTVAYSTTYNMSLPVIIHLVEVILLCDGGMYLPVDIFGIEVCELLIMCTGGWVAYRCGWYTCTHNKYAHKNKQVYVYIGGVLNVIFITFQMIYMLSPICISSYIIHDKVRGATIIVAITSSIYMIGYMHACEDYHTSKRV